MIPRFACCGVAIDALGPDEATGWVIDRAAAGGGGAVHLANAWSLALALDDPGHRSALAAGALVVPDGKPLVWVARRLGLDTADRVYGPDLLDLTVSRGRSAGLRHHLFGAAPPVVAAAASRLRARHRGALIVAADSPPFGPLTDEAVAAATDRLNEVDADVVWVALGTPRQDELMHRLRPLVAPVLVGVGAAFDFLAGAQPQAPRWMGRLGLEWAFRLGTQPRRLGRRYLVGNATFVRGLVTDPPRLLPDQPTTSP